MGNDYRSRSWKEYKAEVIELDGGKCTRCGRSPETDSRVVLQVHHKQYVVGRKAWEYPPGECETLCKGCHAGEHGIIPPSHGWDYVGEDDLGGLHGACELCGTALRHEFYVHHEKWGSMTVGTDCCDRMTGTQEASDHRKRADRRDRFVSSKRWKPEGNALAIKQSGFEVKITSSAGGYRLNIDGVVGHEYVTMDAAKQRVFDFIESGDAQTYFEQKKQRR